MISPAPSATTVSIIDPKESARLQLIASAATCHAPFGIVAAIGKDGVPMIKALMDGDTRLYEEPLY